ncbi:MAG: FAD-dependent oxidoreductase [Candidatus Aminicenantes bacterium]|nr:MAG: FAD-dependent oxidoreductase [Candidatus Aminicenantes bacterium]
MVDTATTITNITTEIVIIGSGPAGLTAGLYTARAGRKALILEGRAASRLSIGYKLENYPGFISIDSQELLQKMREHAEHFGAQIRAGDAINFSLSTDPKYVTTKDALIEAKAVIIATGRGLSKAKMIPGEEKFLGMGVSYCATCDGPLFRSQTVVALGNTDEAAEDILALKGMDCDVRWIPGEPEIKVSEDLLKQITEKGIPPLKKTKIKSIEGDHRVKKVIVETENKEEELDVPAIFIFREIPSTSLFAKAGVELDHRQCIKVDRQQKTNLDGVLAAGDVTCGGLQIASATGEGCVAAIQAINYVRKKW